MNTQTKDIPGVHLVRVAWLKPHEQFARARFEEILAETLSVKGFQWPIIVDLETGVILDGHHRHQVALHLGLSRVPALLVDYLNDDRISVEKWTLSHKGSKFHENCRETSPTGRLGKHLSECQLSSTLDTCGTNSSVSGSVSSDSPPPSADSTNTHLGSSRKDYFLTASCDLVQADKERKNMTSTLTAPTKQLDFVSAPPAFCADSVSISKKNVLQMGMSSSLYPCKTTRHFVPSELCFQNVFFTLNELK